MTLPLVLGFPLSSVYKFVNLILQFESFPFPGRRGARSPESTATGSHGTAGVVSGLDRLDWMVDRLELSQ